MRSQLMNVMMGVLLGVAALELVWALAARRRVHSFRDTLSSLSLGIGQQAINVYLSAGFLSVFAWISENLAVARADLGTWWHWLLFVPACDFCYYAAHRTSHTVNFWVAAHIVHHQAEDFNHLSALRQSWTAWIVNFPFFLPLAFFVPLEMFVVGQLGIMFFQFLSHNGLFRIRLGVLDRIFVTPANHRVHHGINRPYLGANCGGMFVLWDRVFGTFVEEDPNIPIRMGAGLPVNFYDPFEANLDYYRRILFVMRHRRGLAAKVAIWFQSPEVLLRELRELGYDRVEREPINRSAVTAREQLAAGAALVGSVGLLAIHRLSFDGNPLILKILTGILVMAVIWVVGRLLSRPGARQSSAALSSAASSSEVPVGRSDVSAR